MLTDYLNPDMGVVVSFSGKSSTELQHVIEEAGRLPENIVFIEPDNARLLSMAYAKADLVLRTTTCDGETLYKNIALIARKPRLSQNYLYFPTSLLVIKEGHVSDLCAYIFNKLLMKKTEAESKSISEDFNIKIKEIYSKTAYPPRLQR